MRSFNIFRGAILGFLVVFSVFAATQCQADEQVIEVVGIGECADCKEKNIQSNHAFPGLHVTIDCKNQFGKIERYGVGKLNEEGKFKVSLPKEMLKDGNLKHECYAQLHSASLAPCPAQNGLKSIKIVAKNDADGKHITFEPAQKLTFSTDLCTSATFLPHHKPLPKLPKIDWKHHFGHHYKFPPLIKKPLPPKKEEPKKKKPKKPKKEEPKKQMPPIVTPPIISPPIEKPPIKKLPSPPIIPKLPPKDFHHPKLPPFPTIPPKDYHHPKLPPFPTIPPKYLHHPKLPYLPPSPHIPHA